MAGTRHVALLRGINIGSHNRIAMPDLRALCEEIGWADVQTYVQSGNVVFAARGRPAALAAALEAAIAHRLGLAVPVVVRTAKAWSQYVRDNPFPDAGRAEPNLLMLGLSVSRMRPDAGAALCEKAANGERVAQVGDGLWLHFVRGVARSKLTPQALERLAGSPVTMRNWRTVLAVDQLLEAGS